MVRLLPSVAFCVLAISSSSATMHDQAWISQFKSSINVLPNATSDCSVCFFEQTNFKGPKFCVGKRDKGCTRVNPIKTPGTVESIKFTKQGCDLLVNVRVGDIPYGEHVDVISEDVADTGYNLTTYQHIAQEVYVEAAGTACFLGVPTSGVGYGRCYTEDVHAVEDQYRDAFTELMFFKDKTKDFDVIAYEKDNFNGAMNSTKQTDAAASAMSFRFTIYSKTLETDKSDASGVKQTMQHKVRSIEFASPEDLTPGTVSPY